MCIFKGVLPWKNLVAYNLAWNGTCVFVNTITLRVTIEGVGYDIVVRVEVHVTQTCCKLKVVEERSFQLTITCELVSICLVNIQISWTSRVHVGISRTTIFHTIIVLITTYVSIGDTITIRIALENGIEVRHRVDEVHGVVRRIFILYRLILTRVSIRQRSRTLQPVGNLYVHVATSCKTTVVSTNEVTLILRKAYRGISLYAVGTTCKVNTSIYLLTCAEEFVFPTIGVVFASNATIKATCSRVDKVGTICIPHVIDRRNTTILVVEEGSRSSTNSLFFSCTLLHKVVLEAFPREFNEAFGRLDYIVRRQPTSANRIFHVSTDREFACFTFLSWDNDYTVSTARTIKGSSCSVLHKVEALDVLRVDAWEVASVRHTIYHDERRGCGIYWTDTTHHNAWVSTRVTVVLHNLHTRNFTSEGWGNFGSSLVLNNVAFNLGSSTCKRSFCSFTISHNVSFAKRLLVVFECYLHIGRHADGLSSHTEVAKGNLLSVRRYVLQTEVTVGVGLGLNLWTFYMYSSAGYRCTIGVEHTTCHALLGWSSGCSHQQRCSHEH